MQNTLILNLKRILILKIYMQIRFQGDCGTDLGWSIAVVTDNIRSLSI